MFVTTRLGSAAVRVCAVAALVIVAAATLNATNASLSAAAPIWSPYWFGRIPVVLPVLCSLAGLVLLGSVWRRARRRRAKGVAEPEVSPQWHPSRTAGAAPSQRPILGHGVMTTRVRRAGLVAGVLPLLAVTAWGLPGPLALAVAAADAGLLVLLLRGRSPAGTGVAVVSLLLGVYWAQAGQLTRVVAISLLMFLSLLLAGEHATGEPANLVPAAAASGASVAVSGAALAASQRVHPSGSLWWLAGLAAGLVAYAWALPSQQAPPHTRGGRAEAGD